MADETAASYDRVAETYADRFFDDLTGNPLDRALSDGFVGVVQGRGQVTNVGCGPGQAAAYVRERGIDPVCIDLFPAMISSARARTPKVPFAVRSILALSVADASWAGRVALYSIIHIARADLLVAAAVFARVLRPGGVLLRSFHIGDETRHLTEWFGETVDLDVHFYEFVDLANPFEAAGF